MKQVVLLLSEMQAKSIEIAAHLKAIEALPAEAESNGISTHEISGAIQDAKQDVRAMYMEWSELKRKAEKIMFDAIYGEPAKTSPAGLAFTSHNAEMINDYNKNAA